jgi:Fe-S-cluster containining protein
MRNCNDCGVCCTGLLPGEAYGKKFDLDIPCHYLKGKSCSIYESRPPVCVKYQCAWVADESIPDNLDPRITGALMMKTNTGLRVFINSVENEYEADFIEYANSNNVKLTLCLFKQDEAKVINEDGQILS